MIWFWLAYVLVAVPRLLAWLLLPASAFERMWRKGWCCRAGHHWGLQHSICVLRCEFCGCRWFQ